MALNILSAISKKPDDTNQHIRTATQTGRNISRHQSPSVQLPKMSHPLYSDDVTNVGAITYRAGMFSPHEFVIHPEWRNHKDQMTIKTLHEQYDKPTYGYWRKT